jgi:hypothetical protein
VVHLVIKSEPSGYQNTTTNQICQLFSQVVDTLGQSLTESQPRETAHESRPFPGELSLFSRDYQRVEILSHTGHTHMDHMDISQKIQCLNLIWRRREIEKRGPAGLT